MGLVAKGWAQAYNPCKAAAEEGTDTAEAAVKTPAEAAVKTPAVAAGNNHNILLTADTEQAAAEAAPPQREDSVFPPEQDKPGRSNKGFRSPILDIAPERDPPEPEQGTRRFSHRGSETSDSRSRSRSPPICTRN